MTDAKALHRDLMKALLTHLSRTVYGDIRRVVTLAWAVVGLCLTRTVRLTAWAEIVDGRATYAASRVRRFARWLHHSAIDPTLWYPPLLKAALRDWTPDTHGDVALDTTVLGPFVLIRAALVYRGRAIPLAWKAMRHASATVSFDAYRPVPPMRLPPGNHQNRRPASGICCCSWPRSWRSSPSRFAPSSSYVLHQATPTSITM